MYKKIFLITVLLAFTAVAQELSSTNFTNEFIVSFYRGYNPSHILSNNCTDFSFDSELVSLFRRTAEKAKNSSSDEEGEAIVKQAFAELQNITADIAKKCDLNLPLFSILETLKNKDKLSALPFRVLINSNKIKSDLRNFTSSKTLGNAAFFLGSLVDDLFDHVNEIPSVSVSLFSIPETVTNSVFLPTDIITNFTFGLTKGLSRSERRGSKCSKGFENVEDLLKNFTNHFSKATSSAEGLTGFKTKIDDVWGYFSNARVFCEIDAILSTIQEYQTDEGKAKYSAKAVLFKNKIQEVGQDFSKALFAGDFEKCGFDLGSIVQMMTGISLK